MQHEAGTKWPQFSMSHRLPCTYKLPLLQHRNEPISISCAACVWSLQHASYGYTRWGLSPLYVPAACPLVWRANIFSPPPGPVSAYFKLHLQTGQTLFNSRVPISILFLYILLDRRSLFCWPNVTKITLGTKIRLFSTLGYGNGLWEWEN